LRSSHDLPHREAVLRDNLAGQMMSLISIKNVNFAFDVVSDVEGLGSRFVANLNKTINSFRLRFSRADFSEHLEVLNVFNDDFGRPVEYGLVLLVDVLEGQNGR
jgi:hypothetical protein